jgi:hypothetical protein
MAVENKAVTGDDLSRVLATLEGLHTRMDSLETGSGSKNPLKADGRKDEDDKDKDKEKDDAKKDEGEDKDKEKDDAKKDEGAPPPPPAAADGKKDEFPPPKEEKKDEFPPPKDKDEKEDGSKADARADAVISSLRKQIAEQDAAMRNQGKLIERITAQLKPRSDDEHAAFADAQARADAVFMGFGKAAPRPLEGESLLNYRKRLATHLKPHSQVWKAVKFSQLPDEAFSIAEGQVYADAAVAASTPTDLGDGELREVARSDPRTGMRTNVFYGKESFVKSMGRPARRVSSFRTQFPN